MSSHESPINSNPPIFLWPASYHRKDLCTYYFSRLLLLKDRGNNDCPPFKMMIIININLEGRKGGGCFAHVCSFSYSSNIYFSSPHQGKEEGWACYGVLCRRMSSADRSFKEGFKWMAPRGEELSGWMG